MAGVMSVEEQREVEAERRGGQREERGGRGEKEKMQKCVSKMHTKMRR